MEYVRMFLPIIPTIRKPTKHIEPKEKLLWTGMVLIVYLFCCQIPLYGIVGSNSSDPLYWMRAIMASNRGTLMELGISPIVTSSMVMQLLAGLGIMEINQQKEDDRQLFEAAQKIMGVLIAVGQSTAYVVSGTYGDIGLFYSMCIVVQLSTAAILVILLDDLLQNGYGFGSGISLFIATNTCEGIVWRAFSPTTINRGRGTEFEGAVIAMFHLLITRDDKVRAVKEAFYRHNLPNIMNLLATVLVFLVVAFFQGFQVNLKLVSTRMRRETSYPIKLFYTSNMPIILQSALVSNFYFFSQMMFKKFGGNFLVQLLGTWRQVEGSASSQMIPTSGLAYLLSPPYSVVDMIRHPVHALIYLAIMLSMCAVFSRYWINFSGASPSDVARNLRQQGLTIPGHRPERLAHELERYIPIAATFGGLCIGVLSVAADMFGAIGSGTGILLATTSIYGMIESIKKESEESGGFMSIFG